MTRYTVGVEAGSHILGAAFDAAGERSAAATAAVAAIAASRVFLSLIFMSDSVL